MKKKRYKTKAELEVENKMLRRVQISTGIVSVLNTLIQWAAIVIVAKFLFGAIESLAGKTTISDIGINLITDIKISEALCYAIGGGGFWYGYAQNKLRKNTVERLQSRNQALEKKIDKKRSSSQLLPSGDTRPEDRV